ncbi:MAG: hypothetical protein ACR2L9_11915 [Solirubrobacteraceae bacterium]
MNANPGSGPTAASYNGYLDAIWCLIDHRPRKGSRSVAEHGALAAREQSCMLGGPGGLRLVAREVHPAVNAV